MFACSVQQKSDCTELYCTVLYCIVLYCTVVCTILYYSCLFVAYSDMVTGKLAKDDSVKVNRKANKKVS